MKDPETQDNYFLKISGRVSTPELLEINHNYKLTISGSVVSETKEDNDNGSYSITAKFIPIAVEIKTPLGKTIKARDPRSESKKLRARLYKEWESNENPEGFEDFYTKIMTSIRLNSAEIIENYYPK